MSNFIVEYKKGKEGKNKGLDTGLPTLNSAINRLQKKTSIGVAAAPKCGKTILIDFCFVISPYLEAEREGTLDNLQWIYFSYEIDRVSKEFKYAAFFMAYDYKQFNILHKGKVYQMSKEYLMGRLTHRYTENGVEKEEVIPVTPEHEEMLKKIYTNRIIPLFGEHDIYGKKIKEGKIRLIVEADNPTGMRNYLKNYAVAKGKFVTEAYRVLNGAGEAVVEQKNIGWNPNNPELQTIIITDHIRKIKRERGFTMKENIDKWLEYSTEYRNLCEWIFINVCHSNRGITNVDRLKLHGEWIFPTADDVKDTGNLAEESTILMTLFNPNDEKYNLDRHMEVDLKEFPNYRSLHITESRDTACPQHIQMNMYGGYNWLESIFKG